MAPPSRPAACRCPRWRSWTGRRRKRRGPTTSRTSATGPTPWRRKCRRRWSTKSTTCTRRPFCPRIARASTTTGTACGTPRCSPPARPRAGPTPSCWTTGSAACCRSTRRSWTRAGPRRASSRGTSRASCPSCPWPCTKSFGRSCTNAPSEDKHWIGCGKPTSSSSGGCCGRCRRRRPSRKPGPPPPSRSWRRRRRSCRKSGATTPSTCTG
mmetsp:Transcript_86500/g.264687  ORF Transcript_86500/g.264687 Transcript_86500/m.264687 type:complete len:211 (-) Transcript_86500:915-1547(-)